MSSKLLLIVFAVGFASGSYDYSDYSDSESSSGSGEYVSLPLTFQDYREFLEKHEIVFMKFYKES
jgi:hypothetical protein